jgi:hypothetical protein
MSPGPATNLDSKLIRLPKSSPRKYRAYYSTYIRLVRRVKAKEYGLIFEGPLLAPGALAKPEVLGASPVIVECAGPVERVRGSHHWEYLYIAWRYDYEREDWIELGRARAADWTWVLALREIVIAALPRVPLVDVQAESERIAEKVDGVLGAELEDAVLPVRQRSLWLLHGMVCGRIAGIDDDAFQRAMVASGWATAGA